MKPTLRVLIADDEPLVRERLRNLLAADEELTLVAECENGLEVQERLRKESIDLAFLDIQMPELDGLHALEGFTPEQLPVVVFVTAYDRYAVRAFEVRAMDYLLKPFDLERFRTTVQHAKERLHRRAETGEQLLQTLAALAARHAYPTRLSVRDGTRITVVNVDDIDWVESAGNYVSVHVGSVVHLVRDTMAEMEKQLDPERFVRIHRFHIVNLARVAQLDAMLGGDYSVLLKDGSRLTLSRGYRARLMALLGRPD